MDSSQRFAALRYKDFRLLWMGQFISQIGSQMQIVALNWHIYILTHSAFALGLLGMMRFLPIVLFSLLAGTISDKYNRKKVNLITQSAFGILSLILAITTFTNIVSVNIIYLITVLSALTMSFDSPSRQALIPSLVDKKDLTNALSLNTIMWQSATIIGPAIAGFVIGQLSVGTVYFVNALSFIAVIFALSQMKYSGEIAGTPANFSFSSVVEGLKFVMSETMIWSTMILDFFSTLFSSATTLLPIFAKDILRVGPQGLGFLYAAPAVGAVLAGLFMAHRHTLKNQGKILLISVAFYGIGTIFFGFSKIFVLSLFALFIIGAGDSVSTIIRNTIRQIKTPDAIRGRMTAVNMIFFMGGPQLGEFEAGFVAAAVGSPISVVIGGVGTLVVVGLMALKIPKLRNYQGHEVLE